MAEATSARHPDGCGLVLQWFRGSNLRACAIFAILFLTGSMGTPATGGSAFGPIQATFLGSSFDRSQLDFEMRECCAIRAQVVTERQSATAYFLERAPDKIDMSTVPKTARDIVVARVRVLKSPTWIGGRDQSGQPPSDSAPKNLFFSRLEILDVRSGDAAIGKILDVRFGPSRLAQSVTYPHTPKQLGRDYVVVMYLDDDNQRYLAGFAISEMQYREWEEEVREFERLR